MKMSQKLNCVLLGFFHTVVKLIESWLSGQTVYSVMTVILLLHSGQSDYRQDDSCVPFYPAGHQVKVTTNKSLGEAYYSVMASVFRFISVLLYSRR